MQSPSSLTECFSSSKMPQKILLHTTKILTFGKRRPPCRRCQLCSEVQTLHHVLNKCECALKMRRFNQRHDKVLEIIHSFLSGHLLREYCFTADLPQETYHFPQDIASTNSRPDLVFWNDNSICILELTIAFETNFENAKSRKQLKSQDLLRECSKSRTKFLAFRVGSRGILDQVSINHLYHILQNSGCRVTASEKGRFEEEQARKAILGSFDIWTKGNNEIV